MSRAGVLAAQIAREPLDVEALRLRELWGAYSGASTTSSAADNASAKPSWKMLRRLDAERVEGGDAQACPDRVGP